MKIAEHGDDISFCCEKFFVLLVLKLPHFRRNINHLVRQNTSLLLKDYTRYFIQRLQELNIVVSQHYKD